MKTSIRDGDVNETVEFASSGIYYKKGALLYLQFEENLKEVGNVSQLVKIDMDKQEVTVLRKGDVAMRQLFIVNKKTEGTYRSQFGTMLMETSTERIYLQIDEANTRGTIELTYTLQMQEQFAGHYYATINFRRNME